MKPISQEHMSLLIKHFYKVWSSIQSVETQNIVMTNLNEAMRDKFDNAKCNGYMFGINKYDCYVIPNRFSKTMKVSFHRRWKPKYQPGEQNSWKLEFSHDVPLDSFCYNYCNPDIIHVIEKVLFQSL